MFVTPKPGLTVRDPETKRPVPAEGAEVPQSGYWMRRLRDGDLVAGSPPKAPRSDA